MFGIVREEVTLTFLPVKSNSPDVSTSKISTLDPPRGCSSCGGVCCQLFTDMQFILVGLCVKYYLQNFNLIVYGAQNPFVGFRMSAYEQIRNRLSSNGKVMQEAKEFTKRVSM